MIDLLKEMSGISNQILSLADKYKETDPAAHHQLMQLWYATNRVWRWADERGRTAEQENRQ